MTRHSPLATTMWIVNNPLGECVKIFGFSSPSDANVSGGSRRRIDPSTGPTFKGSDRMKMDAFAFGTTNWAEIEKIEHPGETGMAYWRTQFFGEKPNQIRVRMVEYTPGYLADHWCQKGHILFCLAGELETTLKDGRKFTLTTGMSYQVGDNAEPHQSYTRTGAKLFIVD